jgi:polysaccharide export outer membrane protein
LPLVFAVLLGACSGGSGPQRPDDGAGRAQPAHVDPVAAAANDYIIGTGDVLRIQVLRNPDLNAEVPVRPDGKISTPLVSDVVAVGKSPSQLAAEMEKVLGEYVRAPTVSVIVSHSTGDQGKVKVVGQAVAPKAVPYRNGMTVMDLVIEVGGLSQFAAGNRAKIIRTDTSGTHEIRVRLSDLLNKGKISENVTLKPGDILVIPETLF